MLKDRDTLNKYCLEILRIVEKYILHPNFRLSDRHLPDLLSVFLEIKKIHEDFTKLHYKEETKQTKNDNNKNKKKNKNKNSIDLSIKKTLTTLIDKGANIDLTDSEGNYALNFAANYHIPSILEILLKKIDNEFFFKKKDSNELKNDSNELKIELEKNISTAWIKLIKDDFRKKEYLKFIPNEILLGFEELYDVYNIDTDHGECVDVFIKNLMDRMLTSAKQVNDNSEPPIALQNNEDTHNLVPTPIDVDPTIYV